MKLKKILAAIAAFAVCSAMVGVTAFAAEDTADDNIIVDEPNDDGDDVDDGDEFDDGDETDDTDDGDEDEDYGDEDDGDEDDGGDVANDKEEGNPKTGNSPIALAVIPAALAAAAVVAKKAK